MIAQLFFAGSLGTAIYFATKSVLRIRANILLGKPYSITDNTSERIKKMVFVAFGQQKMFDRPIVAMLHLFVYVGFLVVNLEMLEIVIDGLTGEHRIFAGLLGGFYPLMVNVFEFFAVAVLLACAVFWVRRNVLKIKRFWFAEMKPEPRKDANVILYSEIILMSAFLLMNATDYELQVRGAEHYVHTGSFWFSSLFSPLFANWNIDLLIDVERFCWWTHILGVFAFANYLPYSKHLHIILAFPNTYFSKLDSAGKMRNMPEVTTEAKLMLNIPLAENESAGTGEPVSRFGVKDIQDLTWKQIMESYTCTECGRCSSVCPANLTGKVLSPRKIMMDVRDRVEEVSTNLQQNGPSFDDGKSLYGDYISQEELLACTSCNACADACPVNIDPLSIILDMRRYMIMEESKAPFAWNAMFSNMENNMAPWKFSPSDRFNWSKNINP